MTAPEDTSLSELVERLRHKVVAVPNSSGSEGFRLINPDGPAAADLILSLTKQLEEAREVVNQLFTVAAFGKYERNDDERPPLPEHAFDQAMQAARTFLGNDHG